MMCLRFFLAFCLLVPPGSLRASAITGPIDCVSCGHVCCCPQQCAAEQAVKLVESKGVACSLQQAPTSNLLNLKTESVRLNPLSAVVGQSDLGGNDRVAKVFEAPAVTSFSTPFEIPTPPPRNLVV
jgi:hypothetical protein